MSATHTTVPAALLAPRNAYGWTALLRNAVPLSLLLWLTPHVDGWAALAFMPPIGLFAYRLTFVVHDCAHGTLFRSVTVNRLVGGWTAAAVGFDFERYRTLHRRHHSRYGCSSDPQGFHYLGLDRAGRVALLRHLAIPLIGALAPRVLQETAGQLAAGNVVTRTRFVAAQTAIALLVTGGGARPALALLPGAAAATVGLFLSQLRGFAEHAAERGERQAGCVRSHAPNLPDGLLLYELNFNYHAEHHRFPAVPSRHLAALREWLAHRGDRGGELRNGMLRTIGRRLAEG
jgi:fatty acid desaturase